MKSNINEDVHELARLETALEVKTGKRLIKLPKGCFFRLIEERLGLGTRKWRCKWLKKFQTYNYEVNYNHE